VAKITFFPRFPIRVIPANPKISWPFRPPADIYYQMHNVADMDLLAQYVARNSEAAFAALVSRHVNLVYSAALRKTGNPHAAEEVTQAVFIILAKKAGQLRPATILSGWLHQTARLTAANFLRTEIRRARREQEAFMQSLAHESDPEVWRQIQPLLDDALGRLGEKDRNAVALRFFEQKSYSEIGTALNASENAARKRVDYAIEKLRHYFSKHGVISTPALIAAALSAHSVSAAPATLAPAVTALAFTKGTAGAAATLTLVHGALKLMAWTKIKTTALTTAVVLIATLGTIAVVNHSRPAPPRQTGRLKLPTGPVTPMVAYGFSHNILVLAGDGSLWTWGEARLGWPVLGLDDTNIDKTTQLRRIGHDADWVSIATGMDDCLALKADGSIWAWGANYSYQLGDGTKITRPTPVPSVSGNDWKAIAAGQGTSLAIKNDGTLWAWGSSAAGQAGIGGTHNKTSAMEATQVGTATNWAKIWAGPIQTVGLQTDGSLWFWGSLFGDGEATNEYRIPVRASPDTNWVDACFGYFTVFAVKADGTLWTWGNEANYYTGTTDKTSNAVPMQIGTDTDWQSCASGIGFYQILRKKNGSLWALDASEHRTIKPPEKYGPVKLLALQVPQDISAYTAGGDDVGVVVTPAGEVWTWGSVLGEHAYSDYEGPDGQSHHPKLRVMNTPWPVYNEE